MGAIRLRQGERKTLSCTVIQSAGPVSLFLPPSPLHLLEQKNRSPERLLFRKTKRGGLTNQRRTAGCGGIAELDRVF